MATKHLWFLLAFPDATEPAHPSAQGPAQSTAPAGEAAASTTATASRKSSSHFVQPPPRQLHPPQGCVCAEASSTLGKLLWIALGTVVCGLAPSSLSAVVVLSTACGLTVHPFAISFTAVCTRWSQRSLGVKLGMKLGVKQEPEDEPALLPTAQLLSLRSWPQLLSLRSWLCISHLGPAGRLLPRHHALMHTCFIPIRFPALCSTPHTAFWFSAVVH